MYYRSGTVAHTASQLRLHHMQLAGLRLFAKWRHNRRLESITSYPKSDCVNRCVLTRGTFTTNFIPIRFETTKRTLTLYEPASYFWREKLAHVSRQSSRVERGLDSSMDWIGLDWIGLSRNLKKNSALDWIGYMHISKFLYSVFWK